MTKNCVKSIELENGLTLTIEDTSRRISADAFVIRALLSIDFPLTQEDAASVGLSLADLTRTLGSERGRFEKLLERNFIKDEKKEAVFEEVTASYLGTNLTYLSHPEFKKGVIRRGLMDKRGRYGA